jgi:hypothetical protein
MSVLYLLTTATKTRTAICKTRTAYVCYFVMENETEKHTKFLSPLCHAMNAKGHGHFYVQFTVLILTKLYKGRHLTKI